MLKTKKLIFYTGTKRLTGLDSIFHKLQKEKTSIKLKKKKTKEAQKPYFHQLKRLKKHKFKFFTSQKA